MRLHIHHATHYEYGAPVLHAVQALCLTPRSCPSQTVRRWQIQVPGRLFESHDGYGNVSHTYTLAHQVTRGTVRADGEVETHGIARWCEPAAVGLVPPWLYLRTTALTEAHPPLAAWAREQLPSRPGPDDFLALAAAVGARVQYRQGHTDVQTTAAEAYDWGKGVCQDQAHVFIAACRSAGVPVRYVSGYFYDAAAPELASHAWADVCLDIEQGEWLSIDVTHACLIDERHVRLAVGPDYGACPPVKGVRQGGGEERMDVHVDIRALG